MSKKKVSKRSTINPTKSSIANSSQDGDAMTIKSSTSSDMLFNKTTYTYILGGILLMVIGFFLMAGGHNDDPNVFDENVIYSTRRTLIAPIFIIAGLIVQIFAIFKR